MRQLYRNAGMCGNVISSAFESLKALLMFLKGRKNVLKGGGLLIRTLSTEEVSLYRKLNCVDLICVLMKKQER